MFKKKLIPLFITLALGATSASAADVTQNSLEEDKANGTEEKTAVSKTLDSASKKIGEFAENIKKNLTSDGKLNLADAEKTVTVNLDVDTPESTVKKEEADTQKKSVTPLKSISQRTIENKRNYQRPDAVTSSRDGSKSSVKPIPAVPSSYLRGENQTQANLNILKSQASAPLQATPPRTTNVQASSPVKLNSDTYINMKPGENVYIPISKDHPNRLITPFSHPQVISTTLSGGKKKGECGEVCVRDGIIYITTSSNTAVTAFITQKDNEEVAFSVTMLPRAIPPREVHFKLPQAIVDKVNTKKGTKLASSAEGWEQSQPYVDSLRGSLRQVALQEIPPGYSLRAIRKTDPIPRCKHSGLDFDFANGQILEGFNLDIYVGVAENVADRPVEFLEQSCGGWRIAAVTSWPLKVLKPGQKTEVYVVTKKAEEVQSDQVRKPLISREYQ